jgi:hypothetical protein
MARFILPSPYLLTTLLYTIYVLQYNKRSPHSNQSQRQRSIDNCVFVLWTPRHSHQAGRLSLACYRRLLIHFMCLYKVSLKMHHTLSRPPYRWKFLVIIVCWKQNPEILYWWLNDLSLCLIMTVPQRCFRHSISGGHLTYPEPTGHTVIRSGRFTWENHLREHSDNVKCV